MSVKIGISLGIMPMLQHAVFLHSIAETDKRHETLWRMGPARRFS
jgi:hypothetical protein